MSYAQQFKSTQDRDQCGALINAGSLLLVQNVARCKTEPSTYKIGLGALAAAAAESITVFIDAPLPAGITTPTLRLQQGTRLYFADPATPLAEIVAVVTEDTSVTALTSGTAQPVPVEPLPGALTTAMKHSTWNLLRVIGGDDVPIEISAGTEDTTVLESGLHGETTVTSLTAASQSSIIMHPDDAGYWTVLQPASTTGGIYFALVAKPGSSYMFGSAQSGNFGRNGAKQSVQKSTISINYKSDWASPTAFKYLNTTEQNLMKTICKLAGIALPTV
jgi:hypothetical protein